MRSRIPLAALLTLSLVGSSAHARQGSVPWSKDGSAAPSRWSEPLRRAEHHYRPVPGSNGVWSAPNRAQELRSRVSADGLEVFPRAADAIAAAPWRLHLRTTGFGRAEDVVELPPATITVEEERVELDHGRLTEWFVNDERGIEQGWTLAVPPAGNGPLWIALEFGGDLSLRIDEGGRSGVLFDSAGSARLRYRDLLVLDARGRELEARILPGPSGVGIRIEDEGAVYPVIVDPVLTGPAWTADGDQADAGLGISVAPAGDVNGDGYSDVIVGAYRFDNGQSDEGRAHVYLGSPSGLSTTPAWTAESDQAGAHFGWCVATAGDVNGDGYSDVLVGARFHDNGETDEGRGFLYLGSSTGLASSPAWTAEGDQADADFAYSLACAGDVNGDGFSDVVVGAQAYDGSLGQEGRVGIYLGSAAGLAAGPVWTVTSQQENSFFGHSVSTAGDVNGDGYSDVLIAAPLYDGPENDEGRAFLVLGSGTASFALDPWIGQCDQPVANFGHSAATAGDVNGDGYGDVIVGAPLFDSILADSGRAYVYLGSASGLSSTPAWTAEGVEASAHLGWSVATAGDVNGDGYGEVIVGSPLLGPGDEGGAFVYLGSATGLATTPAWSEEPAVPGSFGTSVSAAGDVNGDGYGDVVVGAPLHSDLEASEGRAYVYLGSTFLPTIPSWTAPGPNPVVAGAGDVNGDGYGDVVVRADGIATAYLGSSSGVATTPAWTATGVDLFVNSVAAAGDVNGDGYGDVIIGNQSYSPVPFMTIGRALVYLGSPAGLAPDPDWIVVGDQVVSQFGGVVGAAGDVNGDGFGDVLVAAFQYDNDQVNEGRVYVYLGSPSGLATLPAWTAEGNETGAQFGNSAATAGDVNADGYDDVVVGAPFHSSSPGAFEGRAVLYLGSSSGLPALPTWLAEGAPGDGFGGRVCTAGDVNGDGRSDVVVGAFEGSTHLFRGTGLGLSINALWSTPFGNVPSTAGDIDGDGFDDVLVGGPGSLSSLRRAQIFLGSATTPSPSPSWIVEIPSSFVRVASAGDVNGDGRGDVIFHQNLYSIEGWFHALQQRRKNDLAPLAPLALIGPDGLFRIRGEFTKSLIGFSWASGAPLQAHLEWEIDPLGLPFDGADLQAGSDVVVAPPGGTTTLMELVSVGPPPGPFLVGRYHWRARVVTNNPLFPRSPWFEDQAFRLRVARIRAR